MPGSSRSCLSSMRATGSAHALSVSAAVRYARILKAFAPLISSRSPISARILAICLLSTREAVPFDAEVEQAGAAGAERLANGLAPPGRTDAEEASTATCAAHLCRGGTSLHRPRNQCVNGRRRHAGGQPFPVFPLLGERAAELVPIPPGQCVAHRGRCVADALEAVEHMAIP